MTAKEYRQGRIFVDPGDAIEDIINRVEEKTGGEIQTLRTTPLPYWYQYIVEVDYDTKTQKD